MTIEINYSDPADSDDPADSARHAPHGAQLAKLLRVAHPASTSDCWSQRAWATARARIESEEEIHRQAARP